LSDDELKGRLEMVEAQRNDAMNRSVIQGGQLKVLLATVDKLQKEIDNLSIKPNGNDTRPNEQKSKAGSSERATK
jgi:hypothetical protein